MSIYGNIKPPFGTAINRSHPLSNGLVSMWNFNEGCGDLIHDSCGMNDGRMIGMAPMSGTSGWVPSPHGGALAFDGVDDYVDCGNNASLQISSVFTIPLWVTSYKLAQNGSLIGRAGTDYLLYQSADKLRFAYYTTEWHDNLLNYTIETNMHFLVLVWDTPAGNYKLYVDGDLIITINVGSGIRFADRGTRIGSGEGYYFNGLISSVSIYNRALSAEEIAYLYAFPWCMYEQINQTDIRQSGRHRSWMSRYKNIMDTMCRR